MVRRSSARNKGLVVADGKVIFGRRDNTLMALDQQTGQVVWQTVLTTQRAAHTSAPPIYYDGLIFIGTAGGDVGARGQIGAYDIKTGKEVWRFYTVPGPGERFADTWEGDRTSPAGPACGPTSPSIPISGWCTSAPATPVPTTTDRCAAGTICSPRRSWRSTCGPGAYKWHFQEVRHDIWDYDSSSPPVLADVTYRGRPRKVVIHPGKTGWLYILDRTNGKPLIGIEEKAVPQEPRHEDGQDAAVSHWRSLRAALCGAAEGFRARLPLLGVLGQADPGVSRAARAAMPGRRSPSARRRIWCTSRPT